MLPRTLVALAACVAFAAPVGAQERTVSLADAIRLAEQVQPSIVRANADITNAGAQKRTAIGAFLPSLTASTTGSQTFSEGVDRIDPNTGLPQASNSTTGNVNFRLSAGVDLFAGFRRTADLKAANAQRDAAEAGWVDARYQVALQTTQEFLAALAAAELRKVRQASVARAEEQLNISIAKLRSGSATRSDSLRSLVTLGNTRLQLVTAGTQQATAEANLARLIGVEGRVAAQDEPAFHNVVTAIDQDALRLEALGQSPRVQSAEADAQASRASYSASKAAYWPTLRLAGSFTYSGNSRVNDYELFQSRQASLSLNWPLFNGFTRERNIAQQAGAMDVAEATANDTRRQVSAALTQRFAELDAAALRIEISQTSVVAAEEDLRVQQERYRLGAATVFDVLTSQEALTQAEVDVVNARFDYLRAKAQIEALIGRTL
ncbi:MAG: TolC family protein [Gemmatimonadales bacterium]|nr:TolC family protein [Gemmatimonadales bacterium]